MCFGNNHNVAMTVSSIPTNYDHNKSFTDVSATLAFIRVHTEQIIKTTR